MYLFRTFSILSLSLTLVSCGAFLSSSKGKDKKAESIAATTPPSSARVISLVADSEADLPACTAEVKNQLVYVKNIEEFRYCDSSEQWAAVDVKGPHGDAGVAGSAGSPGISISEIWKYDDTAAIPNSTSIGTVSGQPIYLMRSRLTKYTDGSSEVDATFSDGNSSLSTCSFHFQASSVELSDSCRGVIDPQYSVQAKVNTVANTLKFGAYLYSATPGAGITIPLTKLE
jgi:hypothetical protein